MASSALPRRLKHAFRAKALQDKEHYYNVIAESSLRRNDLKAVYKSIRLICGAAGSSQSMPIARTDGTLCRSAAEELGRWSEHYGTSDS